MSLKVIFATIFPLVIIGAVGFASLFTWMPMYRAVTPDSLQLLPDECTGILAGANYDGVVDPRTICSKLRRRYSEYEFATEFRRYMVIVDGQPQPIGKCFPIQEIIGNYTSMVTMYHCDNVLYGPILAAWWFLAIITIACYAFFVTCLVIIWIVERQPETSTDSDSV